MKEEYQQKLEEKYKKELQQFMNNTNSMLEEKLEQKIKQIKEEYNKKYEQREQETKIKINEMSKIIMKGNVKNNENGNLNMSICQTVHHGIKCQQCFEDPIVGYRYKCSECKEFNLCQNCEEMNSNSGQHPHDFIKIRKEQNNINNNNNNYKNFDDLMHNNNNDNNWNWNNNNNNNHNHNKNKNNWNNNNILELQEREERREEIEEREERKEYSYECTNNMNLVVYIYKGTDEAKIDLNLKNNGDNSWPMLSKLVYDKDSIIHGNDIQLQSQDPGEEKNYEVNFKNLRNCPEGEHKAILWFFVNGKPCGEKLTLKIVIRPKEQVDENEENMDKIKEFRENFGLSEQEYSDEQLLEKLKQADFNFEIAFESLFD
jgi:hypothetical protein